jgi:hypothetical protein
VTTVADIAEIARKYLRDFPKFFSVSFVPQGRTFDLSRPNIDKASLWVAGQTGASVSVLPASTYSVDERNGLLRFASLPVADNLLIEGYHYEWLLPADLEFYAQKAVDLNTHNLSTPLSVMAPAVVDVVGIHALVEALWALLGEYSRDIDVITSESVHIIASQRFRMVQSLLDQWMAEYHKRAQALNIGLDRVEVFTLRRVSKTTNRLVPVYRPREVGDTGPIERLWPAIDPGIVDLEEKEDDLRTDVFVDGDPPPAYVSQNWFL